MEQDLEQSMRDGLEGASLDDLMPDFDKEGEWDRLNRRLHPKRRMAIPVIWSHAAAVLVGITIGWVLLKNTGRPAAGEHSMSQAMTTPIPPTVQVIHDTIVSAQTAAIPAVRTQTIVKTVTVQQHDTILMVAGQTATPVPAAPDTMEMGTQKGTEAVATTRKPRPQAVHLLDVESGDKSMLVSPEYADMPHGLLNTIQRVIFNQNAMVNSDDQAADRPYVIRHILTK